jgi:carboxypeptidase Taq
MVDASPSHHFSEVSMSLIELKNHLAEIHHLAAAGSVLAWDQRTYMPPRGAGARASQQATLGKIRHEMFVSDRTRDLLAAARNGAGNLDPESDDAAYLRVATRDFEKATRVPTDLVVEITRVTSLAQEVWAESRKNNEFSTFAPWLEKIIGLRRQYAQVIGYSEHLYDALLDDYEQGMTVGQLDPIFAELKQHTVPLVAAILERTPISDEALARDYDEAAQQTFSERILRACAYDFSRGRLDRAVHPFCITFAVDDVRITTRYERNWLPGALFGSLHEMGHALYEMNCAPALDGNILAGGVSLGVHESQSRLWENLVGRSRPFWQCYYPELQRHFPRQLDGVPMEEFYRAINRVKNSLIRVEADEITYNLHIVLRYEMEVELLEGRLSVADAPAAWNARMKQYLGITPPNDAQGILQDVHWSAGLFGYFPTYTLGNIFSVQLFQTALAANPAIPEEISRGQFTTLLAFLRDTIHRHGRKYPPVELVRKSTGQPLTVGPYAKYLKSKFGELYKL